MPHLTPSASARKPYLSDYRTRFAVAGEPGRQYVGLTRSPDARRLADLGYSDDVAAELADLQTGAAILQRAEYGMLAGVR